LYGGSSSSSVCSDLDSTDSQNGDIQSLYSDSDCHEVLKQILQQEQPTRIVIKLHVTGDKCTQWDSILNPNNNILYVALPEEIPLEGSQQSFISLLEFADDKLDVDAVVLCVRKDIKDRARLLESFLIMGFQPLSRKSPLAPPAAQDDADNFFLIYEMEE